MYSISAPISTNSPCQATVLNSRQPPVEQTTFASAIALRSGPSPKKEILCEKDAKLLLKDSEIQELKRARLQYLAQQTDLQTASERERERERERDRKRQKEREREREREQQRARERESERARERERESEKERESERVRELTREIQQLRRERNGVEVYDVDAGVSDVVERNDTELPAKRVRREQAVTASEFQALHQRLVEVKKEKDLISTALEGRCLDDCKIP